MDEMDELNWSAVARNAFESKLVDLDKLEEIRTLTSKSKFTEEDALELGHKVNAAIARRHDEAFARRQKAAKGTKP